MPLLCGQPRGLSQLLFVVTLCVYHASVFYYGNFPSSLKCLHNVWKI